MSYLHVLFPYFPDPDCVHSLWVSATQSKCQTLHVFRWIYGIDISLAEARLAVSWPHLVLTALDYAYIDDECEVSITRIDVIFHIFPHPLRLLGGKSFGSVKLGEFRTYIRSSEKSPAWLEELRRTCIFTILNGTTVRLDDFKTTVTFKDEQGHTRVAKHSKQWHIHNPFNRRMYIFGQINAVMHRNWETDYGVLSLLAEHCEWNMIPSNPFKEGWNQLVNLPNFVRIQSLDAPLLIVTSRLPYQIRHFFLEFLPKFFEDPLIIMDLYIERCDVTFGHFRLHDAELVRQGGVALEMNLNKARRRGAFDGFSWDMALDTLVRILK